nr:MAG TPA: hypothetical protein [Caudoviricetes sp.]
MTRGWSEIMSSRPVVMDEFCEIVGRRLNK